MGVFPPQIRYGYFGLAFVVILAVGLSLDGVIPPLRCPFKTYVGLSCPMCGTTRAWHNFIHGHFREAFVWNPLFLVWGAVSLVAFLDLLHKGTGGLSPTVGEMLTQRLAASPRMTRLFTVSTGLILIYNNREAIEMFIKNASK
jgi:hypothetical protein